MKILSVSCLTVFLIICVADAGDWPQILGPNRTGEAIDETLAAKWPASGPRRLWQRSVGSGFAGVAVSGRTTVLFHRVGDNETVEAMDSSSGDLLWQKRFHTKYQPGFTSDDGPRCVPLIHERRVYVFGSAGGLRALDAKNGNVIWTRETHRDFGAKEGYFGAGSTPLIEGDRLIVNVGSRDGAAVVAFDRSTGKTLWRAVDDVASYSSPIAATVDNVRHVILVTRFNAVSVDPMDGAVRFIFPFGKRGPTVNGSSPIVIDGHLFLTASYGIGSVLRRIHPTTADEVWQDQQLMASQYATCVQSDGLLYGLDGRQDGGRRSATLKCFNPKTRRLHWSKDGFDYGTPIKADGKLIVLTSGGDLILTSLNSERYHELARASVLEDTPRGYRLPALANGRLYVRDNHSLKCLDLR